MGHCTQCNATLAPTDTSCRGCGASTRALPSLTPPLVDELEEGGDLKTIVSRAQTLPMVGPPPFTPPPFVSPSAITTPTGTPAMPSPVLATDDQETPSYTERLDNALLEDNFDSSFADFTEISALDDELDELDEVAFEESEGIFEEALTEDLSPLLISDDLEDTTHTAPLYTPQPSFAPITSPIPRQSEPETTRGVSALLALAHTPQLVSILEGSTPFGAQHDPTNGLLDELYPHHFNVSRGNEGLVQVHAVGDAELWVRVARRVRLEPHDVFKIGERRLCLAPTEGVLSRAYQGNTTHQPLTQSGPLSLLVFDPAGRLEALFPLSEGVTRLGRALADVTLNDPSVSLSHAALLLEEGCVTLVDLSSDSGVWRLARAPFELHHNLVFSAGHTLFVAR